MSGNRRIRIQAGLAATLFLGSLGGLLYNALTTAVLPERELEFRNQLRESSRLMARSADDLLRSASGTGVMRIDDLHRKLAAATTKALEVSPGFEAGYYLGEVDRFAGYASSTHGHAVPYDFHRTDPPPLEAPYIRLQARQSLTERTDTPLFTVRDVGPSRVMIVTEAIGSTRPSRMATWAMVRLTGPELLEGQLHRYQWSIGLALAGLALSLLLTITLIRSVAAYRADQDLLREKLRRSEQLASLGTMLAGVAHEIRNPLAGIRSTVQLWQRIPDQFSSHESLGAVLQATERLNHILTQLLHFSRTEHVNRHPTQLNDLMTETFTLLEAQGINQSVRMTLDLEPRLPLVSGSPPALRQILLNIVTNAFQVMPNGGCLIGMTRHRQHEKVVEIMISDTGPGVPDQDRPRLFEPFFTTRPEGTGLGLALCREIVNQHGGQIDLAGHAGPGAAFRILLPANNIDA